MKINIKKEIDWSVFFGMIILVPLILLVFVFALTEFIFKFVPEEPTHYLTAYLIFLVITIILSILIGFFDYKQEFRCRRCFNKFYEECLYNICKKDIQDKFDETLICYGCMDELKNLKVKK